jgi:hypothetical protein
MSFVGEQEEVTEKRRTADSRDAEAQLFWHQEMDDVFRKS